ncbi:hypothetical protein [Wolbachia endosymbiont of Folsomia candida]|uniref:hypothetical protein n=1 Tax=Wolbachia endosymbiont of Folsomia candida TaxID=169402 RepID=UPI000B0EDFCF|nr:hypothetical protein [Wolbachia endosymbiont of Folsomia candida]APR98178.1 hypothetical protein ASM33_02595 [Wolbachia endosymbiont of Folsomia candida]
MVKTTKDSELFTLLRKALHSEEQSPYANKLIVHDITAPSAPEDYESTKHKVAQREFVKNLSDTATARINKELIPQLNIKFNDYDELIEKNTDHLDQLSDEVKDVQSMLEQVVEALDLNASNQWT